MKQILILILTFSLFACSKDEKSNTLSSQKSEKDIFNAVIGTWIFNRMGYDPEFKKVKEIEADSCAFRDYTIFRNDRTSTAISGCFNNERTGTFFIQFGGYSETDTNIHIRTNNSGLRLVPGMGEANGAVLYSYTDSTLVFTGFIYEGVEMYSELKRVK